MIQFLRLWTLKEDIAAKCLSCHQSKKATKAVRAAVQEEAENLRIAAGMPPRSPDRSTSGLRALTGTRMLRLIKMEPPSFSREMMD